MVEGEAVGEFSGASSYKSINSVIRASPLTTSSKHNYLPKNPSPNSITLRVRGSIYEFGGGAHFSP